MKRPFQLAGMRTSKPTCGRIWPVTRQWAGAAWLSATGAAMAMDIWLLVRLRRSGQPETGLFWAESAPAASRARKNRMVDFTLSEENQGTNSSHNRARERIINADLIAVDQARSRCLRAL